LRQRTLKATAFNFLFTKLSIIYLILVSTITTIPQLTQPGLCDEVLKMVMDFFSLNPLSAITQLSLPDSTKLLDSIEWFYGYGIIEDLLNNCYRLLLTLQTQIINSSSRDYIRRGLHATLGLLLLCCRCQTFDWFGNHNSINSATYILPAMPTFDVSHGAGLIIFNKICFKIWISSASTENF